MVEKDKVSPYLKEKHQGHLISWNDWAIEVSLNSARGCQMVEKDKVSPYLKEKHQGHLISWNDWAIEPWGNDPRPVLESYQIPHTPRNIEYNPSNSFSDLNLGNIEIQLREAPE
jgi:hypothetical protein